mgnify:CR=1 FL=1
MCIPASVVGGEVSVIFSAEGPPGGDDEAVAISPSIAVESNVDVCSR